MRESGETAVRVSRFLLILNHSCTICRLNQYKYKFSPSSFKLQLVGLQVILVKVANIYHLLSSLKPRFLDEFADLLSMIGQGGNEWLVICSDFSLGEWSNQYWWTACEFAGHAHQTYHVISAVNVLDLLIKPTTSSQPLICSVAVLNTHQLSDHDLSFVITKSEAGCYQQYVSWY